MWRFCSAVNVGVERIDSSRCWIQRFCAGSERYMNSAPMLQQYVSRSALIRSRSVMFSCPKYVFAAANTVSMSASVRS